MTQKEYVLYRLSELTKLNEEDFGLYYYLLEHDIDNIFDKLNQDKKFMCLQNLNKILIEKFGNTSEVITTISKFRCIKFDCDAYILKYDESVTINIFDGGLHYNNLINIKTNNYDENFYICDENSDKFKMDYINERDNLRKIFKFITIDPLEFIYSLRLLI